MADPISASGAHEFHVLVLAAGASARLGSPKQLARVRGRPALQIVVDTATAVAGQSVTVVVGAHAAEIMPMLSRKGAIGVAVDQLATTDLGNSRAETRFLQAYTSERFKDTGSKTLTWQRIDGQWLIVKESNR